MREITLKDFYSLYKLLNDSSISNFYTSLPYPFCLVRVIRYVLKKRFLRLINWKSDLRFIIELKERRKIAGEIGLYNNFENRNCEISYWIGTEYRGKGIGSEAMSLVLSFGFKELKVNKVIARVIEYNAISKRLLRKYGFELEGIMRKNRLYKGHFYDEFMYGLFRDDFLT